MTKIFIPQGWGTRQYRRNPKVLNYEYLGAQHLSFYEKGRFFTPEEKVSCLCTKTLQELSPNPTLHQSIHFAFPETCLQQSSCYIKYFSIIKPEHPIGTVVTLSTLWTTHYSIVYLFDVYRIRSDHNEDNTSAILHEWSQNVKQLYHRVLINVSDTPSHYENSVGPGEWTETRYRQMMYLRQRALDSARKQWADYLFVRL